MMATQGAPLVGGSRTMMAPQGRDAGGGGVNLGCGGIEAMCIEPSDPTYAEGGLAFVGQGRGAYEMVTNIQYVGPGGSYDREKIVTNNGWRCRWWCLLLLVMLLIASVVALVFLLIPQQSSAPPENDVQATTSMPFDCEAGYWNWQKGWSESKKLWCCNNRNRGCPSTSTGEPYDCQAGLSNWQSGWSRGKKLWCCTVKNLGCPVPTTSLPFDCDAGFFNWHIWAPAKKTWCCAHYNKGCHVAVKKSCTLWGDPHIFTFDHSRLVFYSEGDFWIVKSPSLGVQGRFQATDWTKKNDKTDYSSMTEIIVSGPLIQHHKVMVGAMEGGSIFCDGQTVLHNFGTAKCGDATVRFDNAGQLVDSAMAFLPHKVVHIYLPNGVELQVNRWPNFINAKITMTPLEQQTGICGDFDGHSKQGLQAGKELHARFGYGVPSHELLFSDSIPLHIPTARPSSKRCSPEKRAKAHSICQQEAASAPGWSVAECLGDVCDPHTAGMTSITAQEMQAKLGN